MEQQILDRAKVWLGPDYDPETRSAVQDLIDNNPKELADSFYTDLEFGTGGLRGVMGPGTNRMNRFTVGQATQGLANYINEQFQGGGNSVAIAHDCRHNSPYFSKVAAEVFAANGIDVYLFTDLRPTPELSFAIRHLGCRSGIVVTASHNPPEYNGYKVYWEDGAQIVEPHDERIIAHVRAIAAPSQVRFSGGSGKIHKIDQEVDEPYMEMVLGLTLSPKAIEAHADIPIVYTALHGTGGVFIPEVLKRKGFTRVYEVPEQAVNDGNFPTVASPNPEEKPAMKMAMELGVKTGAVLVMGTDPDGDRVGIGVRNANGELELLNGNQAVSMLVYYLLLRKKEEGVLPPNAFVCSTIVTTDLVNCIAEGFNIPCYNTLTGFKHIAAVIRKYEGEKVFIGGGEESYGYMIGDAVRDKDAVAACAMFAEMAAWCASHDTTLYRFMADMYVQFGYHKESLLSITKKGREGAEAIAAMMEGFRTNPPTSFGGVEVVRMADYRSQEIRDLKTGERKASGLPKSNVLQFFLADGGKVTARPSGTEPKIKFYVALKDKLSHAGALAETEARVNARIETILDELR